MYPPPPGSDPGYQEAHYWIPTYAKNALALRASAPPAALAAEEAPMAGVSRRLHDGSCAASPLTPPICGRRRTITASTIVPVMASTNWKASVTATPQRPLSAE